MPTSIEAAPTLGRLRMTRKAKTPYDFPDGEHQLIIRSGGNGLYEMDVEE